LRKYYYLNRYLHESDEGLKLTYAFKGGLTDSELKAGNFFLEEYRRTPRRLAILPVAFIAFEAAKFAYNKFSQRAHKK
jgi:hypothetical protein